jgi:hypothetical protein
MSELICQNEDGVIASLAAWVNVTIDGLRDRTFLLRMGNAARQSATRFDWETVVQEVDEIYRDVVRTTAGISNASKDKVA